MSDYTTEAEVSVNARRKRRQLIVLGVVVLGLFFAFWYAWSYYQSDNSARAYLRQPDGKLKTLFFEGAATTVATAINNNGAIGGYWFDTSNRSHGCLWLQQ